MFGATKATPWKSCVMYSRRLFSFFGNFVGGSGGNANNDNNLTSVQWSRLSAVGVASDEIDDELFRR